MKLLRNCDLHLELAKPAKVKRKCPHCWGDGWEPGTGMRLACKKCHGGHQCPREARDLEETAALAMATLTTQEAKE